VSHCFSRRVCLTASGVKRVVRFIGQSSYRRGCTPRGGFSSEKTHK
jgi:hypothetical protein